MALLTSRTLKGRCALCGAANSSCGPHSEGTRPVDDYQEEEMPAGPPDVIAKATVNGYKTQILTHTETAEANGWEVVRRVRPNHKKIEAPTAPAPAEPAEPAEPVSDGNEDDDGPSYDDLYSLAQDLEIKGRSKMDKDQLVTAIAEAQAGEKVG